MINNIKTIGIVGGGQLGRMMIPYIKKLGLKVAVLDPSHDCPCAKLCDVLINSSFTDEKGYAKLAEVSDVITYEFEHIDTNLLKKLEKNGSVIYPSVESLHTIQDKFTQKTALKNAGIAVPDFYKIDSLDALKELYSRLGNKSLMLKSRKGGYDGKGNAVIKTASDIEPCFNLLVKTNGGLMAEPMLEFECEVSVIAARGIGGEMEVFPIAENLHKDSILDITSVPSAISKKATARATECAKAVLECFKGVGTFCAELFILKNGEVQVNEVAPRVHNSGHYTIEACATSQFENHIRTIVGLKPASTAMLYKEARMKNIIATTSGEAVYNGLDKVINLPNIHVHIYGKTTMAKGRKMGHITIVGNDKKQVAQSLRIVDKVFNR